MKMKTGNYKTCPWIDNPGEITDFAATCMGSSQNQLLPPVLLLSEKLLNRGNGGIGTAVIM
jgi:hypothetical protein